MQSTENKLISIKYIDSNKKVLKSIFSYYSLPVFFALNLMTLYTLSTYRSLNDLSGPFALSIAILAGMLVLFVSIVIFLGSFTFLQRKYSSLEIFQNTIIINSKDIYNIENVEYVNMPYISVISHWFQLRDKNSKKMIGHFVYRFYDMYFFNYSPEIIKKTIESNSLINQIYIKKSIAKDNLLCIKRAQRNEKIKIFTTLLFVVLIVQLAIMLSIKFHI